jgi:phosphatidate phosphatase APP1
MDVLKSAGRGVLSAGYLLNRKVLRRARVKLFGRKPAFVIPFIGHVIGNRLLLHGRVLRSGAPPQASRTDSKWRNFANSLRKFATHEVSGGRVRVRFEGVDVEAVTDFEGYFDVDATPASPDRSVLWQQARVELLSPSDQGRHETQAPVLVHPMTGRFGVISDIDDTVVTTHVTSPLQMLATVLLSNAHTRLPFPGIGAFYRALERGEGGDEHNPIFYVSNGPWNLHDLLVEFFELNDIPLGPLYLRDFGHHLLLSKEPPGQHKREAIELILKDFPDLPFVLIGDSGEHDPAIYVEMALRHPNRVRGIYIRCVHNESGRIDEMKKLARRLDGTDTHFVLAADSESAAVDALEQGLITEAELEKVRQEIARCRNR